MFNLLQILFIITIWLVFSYQKHEGRYAIQKDTKTILSENITW